MLSTFPERFQSAASVASRLAAWTSIPSWRPATVWSRASLVSRFGRHATDNAVKRRALVAVFPRVYAYPWDVDQPDVRRRAALLSVGGDAAISHLSALAIRDLPAPGDEPLPVTAYLPGHPRGVPGELIVHRTVRPLDAVEIGEVPVVRTETALMTSWPLLSGAAQRAPAETHTGWAWCTTTRSSTSNSTAGRFTRRPSNGSVTLPETSHLPRWAGRRSGCRTGGSPATSTGVVATSSRCVPAGSDGPADLALDALRRDTPWPSPQRGHGTSARWEK